jgi:hypothetical protein
MSVCYHRFSGNRDCFSKRIRCQANRIDLFGDRRLLKLVSTVPRIAHNSNTVCLTFVSLVGRSNPCWESSPNIGVEPAFAGTPTAIRPEVIIGKPTLTPIFSLSDLEPGGRPLRADVLAR